MAVALTVFIMLFVLAAAFIIAEFASKSFREFIFKDRSGKKSETGKNKKKPRQTARADKPGENKNKPAKKRESSRAANANRSVDDLIDGSVPTVPLDAPTGVASDCDINAKTNEALRSMTVPRARQKKAAVAAPQQSVPEIEVPEVEIGEPPAGYSYTPRTGERFMPHNAKVSEIGNTTTTPKTVPMRRIERTTPLDSADKHKARQSSRGAANKNTPTNKKK